jgi:hypothetical protein
MKKIKKAIDKFLKKRGYKKLSKVEKKMINMSIAITEEYINSRKFRRALKETQMAHYIETTLNEWNDYQEKKTN